MSVGRPPGTRAISGRAVRKATPEYQPRLAKAPQRRAYHLGLGSEVRNRCSASIAQYASVLKWSLLVCQMIKLGTHIDWVIHYLLHGPLVQALESMPWVSWFVENFPDLVAVTCASWFAGSSLSPTSSLDSLDFDGIFSSHDLRLSELLPSKDASNKDSWSLVCTTGEKVRVCGSCKTL